MLTACFASVSKRFFDLFTRHAETVVAGAEALRHLLRGEDEILHCYKLIVEREAQADEITRAVLMAVRRSFITPFDRSDIHSVTPHRRARSPAARGHRRLSYVGGTRRSVLPVGFNARQMSLRQSFKGADGLKRDDMRRRHGDNGGRATQAPDLSLVVRIVVALIRRDMHMSCALVPVYVGAVNSMTMLLTRRRRVCRINCIGTN